MVFIFYLSSSFRKEIQDIRLPGFERIILELSIEFLLLLILYVTSFYLDFALICSDFFVCFMTLDFFICNVLKRFDLRVHCFYFKLHIGKMFESNVHQSLQIIFTFLLFKSFESCWCENSARNENAISVSLQGKDGKWSNAFFTQIKFHLKFDIYFLNLSRKV